MPSEEREFGSGGGAALLTFEAPVERPTIWDRLDPAIRDRWEMCALAEIGEPAVERLLTGTAELHLEAGEMPELSSDWLVLVISGLLRTFQQNGERQVTTRYAADADFIGIPAAILGGVSTASLQAIDDARLLKISSRRLRELVQTDPKTSWIVMKEVVRLHNSTTWMICNNVFLPIRQRVATHLLDLAVREDDEMIVRATHQDLADAVGSVREVVSRVVREMRKSAVIERVEAGTLIADPAALHRLALGS